MAKNREFHIEIRIDGSVAGEMDLVLGDEGGVPDTIVPTVVKGMLTEWMASKYFLKPEFVPAAEGKAFPRHKVYGEINQRGQMAGEYLTPELTPELSDGPVYEAVVDTGTGKVKGLVTQQQLATRLCFKGDPSQIPASGNEEVAGLGSISWTKATISAPNAFINLALNHQPPTG